MAYSNRLPEQPIVVNIAGATASNNAEAENRAVNVNVLQAGTGQAIDITQDATAVVNNMTTIVIGPPYPVSLALNDDDKTLNVEIMQNGDIRLNGEVMDVKALSNGIKVMFLHSGNKDNVINDKSEKNVDNENEVSN